MTITLRYRLYYAYKGDKAVNIKEIAKLSGVSVRTLHHYDQIGLLCPERNYENSYRIYSDDDLDKLQQILLFKACGFSLAMIQTMLSHPLFDREEALRLQQKTLLYEQQRIETMLNTLNKTLIDLKGDHKMTNYEKFVGFDLSHNPYEEEARQRWGDEVIDQSNAFMKDKKKEIEKSMNDLFRELATIRNEKPDSKIVQESMEKMYCYFNENFGYHYSYEAFAGLGQMYISDERFTQHIDCYGDGLAKFLVEAMSVYVKNKLD